MDKKDIYRSIITSHAAKPNKMVTEVPSGFVSQKAEAESCSDEYEVFIKIEEDKIKQIMFTGHGCSISKSSLNILCNYVEGKDLKDALALLANYKNMITGKDFKQEGLNDLIAFENISQYMNRVSCASIGANAIIKLIGAVNE